MNTFTLLLWLAVLYGVIFFWLGPRVSAVAWLPRGGPRSGLWRCLFPLWWWHRGGGLACGVALLPVSPGLPVCSAAVPAAESPPFSFAMRGNLWELFRFSLFNLLRLWLGGFRFFSPNAFAQADPKCRKPSRKRNFSSRREWHESGGSNGFQTARKGNLAICPPPVGG